jgi:hypothetical protein
MKVGDSCQLTFLSWWFTLTLADIFINLLFTFDTTNSHSSLRFNHIILVFKSLIRALDSFLCAHKCFGSCVLKLLVCKLLLVGEICAWHAFPLKYELSVIEVIFTITDHLDTYICLVFLRNCLVHKRSSLDLKVSLCVYLLFSNLI